MKRYPIPDTDAFASMVASFVSSSASALKKGGGKETQEVLPVYRTEQTIKGSLFLCSMGHAQDVDTARAFVEQIKQEFPDATHNCWAFAVGPPKDTARVGFSDDGEPHGTAGRPMLTVLHHSGVGELVCVVTRYFGGVKLGTGGLVRAYQGAVAENLRSLPTKERITPAYVHFVVEYTHIENVRRLLPSFEAKILQEVFSADAAFDIRLPEEHLPELEKALLNLTDGMLLLDSKKDV